MLKAERKGILRTYERLPLTDERVEALTAPAQGFIEVSDLVVPGLRLRIKSTGIKTFSIRIRENGKTRSILLGDYDFRTMDLADARRRAWRFVNQGRHRRPPSSRESREPSIGELLPRYLASKRALKSVNEIERLFKRHILASLGKRVPWDVRRSEVTALADNICSPRVSRSVVAQLNAFFNWLMPRYDELQSNPCLGAGRPPVPPPRERVLSDDEIRCLWKASETDSGPIAIGVRLLVLTLLRRGEVFGASTSELDLETCVWTIPADRSKNGRAHDVPLSERAKSLLTQQMSSAKAGLLFPSRGSCDRSISGFSKAWKRMRTRANQLLGYEAVPFTMHDLRRTGATKLQQLGVPIPVTESVLNHVSGSRSGIVSVYQRHAYATEKRQALELWDAELQKLIS